MEHIKVDIGIMDDYRQDIRDIRKAYSLIKEFIEKSNWKADKPVALLDQLYQKTEDHIKCASNKSVSTAIFPPTDITDEDEESGFLPNTPCETRKSLMISLKRILMTI